MNGGLGLGLLVLEEGRLRRATLEELREAALALLMLVPPGRVTTYGSIARLLGVSPRLVGRFMAENRDPIVVPCHRVVRSDGSLGGYSGPGGVGFKRRLLELEGVRFLDGRVDPESMLRLDTLLLGREGGATI